MSLALFAFLQPCLEPTKKQQSAWVAVPIFFMTIVSRENDLKHLIPSCENRQNFASLSPFSLPLSLCRSVFFPRMDPKNLNPFTNGPKRILKCLKAKWQAKQVKLGSVWRHVADLLLSWKLMFSQRIVSCQKIMEEVRISAKEGANVCKV